MKLLEDLSYINCVSGNEETIIDFIIENIKDSCDEQYRDNYGNLIVHLKGDGKKAMINTSVDELGFLITYIEDDGKIRFSDIGKCDALNIIYKEAVSTDSSVKGIIAADKDSKLSELKISDLYIDIGAFSNNTSVQAGDIFTLAPQYLESNNMIFSKGIKSRVGIYVLINTIKELYKSKNYCNDLYFAFTVQDNLGYKGAKVAAQSINPDYAIVLSYADTKNTDGTKIEVNKGVAVKIKDSIIITNKPFRNSIIGLLKENSIPYQLEISITGGAYNSEVMYLNGGILTLTLSCPVNYSNTAFEGISSNDIKSLESSILGIINKGL